MQAINTSGGEGYDQISNDVAFLPEVTVSMATATKIFTFTEAGAVGSDDTFKAVIITLFDKNGAYKSARISTATGTATIDADASTSLDLTGPLRIKATVVTANGFAKEGALELDGFGADIAATDIVF